MGEPDGMRTDDAGRVTVRGWFGEYEVAARGTTSTFALTGDVEVRLT